MEFTVLPTFLSKVRACTVGPATGLAPRRAFTVAGLCRHLTGFATPQRLVARYHGAHLGGRSPRWRLRALTHAPLGALASGA